MTRSRHYTFIVLICPSKIYLISSQFYHFDIAKGNNLFIEISNWAKAFFADGEIIIKRQYFYTIY
jgi:hypothetical protein